ncbi:hypothetical protein [Mycolicibacterium sp.]|uniref:hypothetical protein n=1 Tax=Mycolicibacterium sp. TaxID=2320850 RepID=UPI003D0ACF94
MRLVLGISLTASSAVWTLVDTADGTILASESVEIEAVTEIARAAARSVQAFDAETEFDIEGVRLTYSEDARPHGIRLREKLRLAGFDVIETVDQEVARENRNRTARHIAPHLVLAYGAARTELPRRPTPADLLGRLTERVHMPALGGLPRPELRPVPLAAAAALVAAVLGVTAYLIVGTPASPDPAGTAAEPAPAAAPSALPAPAAVPPAPSAVAPPPPPVPAEPAPVDSVVAWEPAPEVEVTWQPETETEATWQPTTTWQPEVATAPEAVAATAVGESTIAIPQTVAVVGEPHLTGTLPAAGPVPAAVPVPQPGAVPVVPAGAPQPVPAPIAPVPPALAPQPAPAPPAPGPLAPLFGALP